MAILRGFYMQFNKFSKFMMMGVIIAGLSFFRAGAE